MNRLIFLLLMSVLPVMSVCSQDKQGLRFLNYNRDIPGDLLSSKILVMVSVTPHDTATALYNDWATYARKTHEYFRKIGVEAVTYFNKTDVFASAEAQQSYFKKIASRNIDHICLISHEHVAMETGIAEQEVMVITKFNGKHSFISHGQPAYRIENKSFHRLMITLAKAVRNSGQSSSNFLIDDQPEIVKGLPLLVGDKIFAYNDDLKVSKLAVQKFATIEIPEKLSLAPDSTNELREIIAYNKKVPVLNDKLKTIMSTYPYPYDIIDFDGDEKAVFNKGYQFMLWPLTASTKSVMSMLEIKNQAINMIPVEDMLVTKFYVKQLFSKYIYVGSVWEAKPTWEEALKAFIEQVKLSIEN